MSHIQPPVHSLDIIRLLQCIPGLRIKLLSPYQNFSITLESSLNEIHSTDKSLPGNLKGSCKPLKTLWRNTMGVQSLSTLPTLVNTSYLTVYGLFSKGCKKDRNKAKNNPKSRNGCLFVFIRNGRVFITVFDDFGIDTIIAGS